MRPPSIKKIAAAIIRLNDEQQALYKAASRVLGAKASLSSKDYVLLRSDRPRLSNRRAIQVKVMAKPWKKVEL